MKYWNRRMTVTLLLTLCTPVFMFNLKKWFGSCLVSRLLHSSFGLCSEMPLETDPPNNAIKITPYIYFDLLCPVTSRHFCTLELKRKIVHNFFYTCSTLLTLSRTLYFVHSRVSGFFPTGEESSTLVHIHDWLSSLWLTGERESSSLPNRGRTNDHFSEYCVPYKL